MWEEIRAVLIWPLSPRWDEAHIIFFFFFPIIFLFVICQPDTVCAVADRVNFTPISGHFQSQHIPDQLHFIFFDHVICPFFILNGSHTGVKRPKKEINEVELPFEIGEPSLPTFHLIRPGWCFWVAHRHATRWVIADREQGVFKVLSWCVSAHLIPITTAFSKE